MLRVPHLYRHIPTLDSIKAFVNLILHSVVSISLKQYSVFNIGNELCEVTETWFLNVVENKQM